MKTVFVIAGLNIHATAAHKVYLPLSEAIGQKGYKVISVDISWRQTTPSQFTEKFIDLYERQKGTYNIVIGNSFGAVVAFISALKIKPNEIFLCSLSPFFKEDFNKNWPTRVEYRRLGKKRISDIQKYSTEYIASNLKNLPITFKLFYGEQENKNYSMLVKGVKQTAKMLSKAKLVEIPNAPHSFSDPNYIRGIVAEL